MKQTAIEWLISEWLKLDSDYYIGNIGRIEYREKRNQKHNEAKELEKKEIVDCWNKRSKIDGVLTFTDNRTGEEYYNETFKK
jgi:hypothetical protein